MMPQYDMKKSAETASHYASRTQKLQSEKSECADAIAKDQAESALHFDASPSALLTDLSTALKELAIQPSSKFSGRHLSSASAVAKASANPKTALNSRPKLMPAACSEAVLVGASLPKTPKTPSKRRERDTTLSPLKSDKKISKPQPSLPTNFPSVTQSSDLITIFIDGSNLFYAASHLNIEVDYRRLLSSLVRGRRLLRAYFYTGVDPQNEKQRGFLLWLNRHGHRVVSKELTTLPDGSRKANMHVEMAVDMMRISEYCPNITLLGGDGNLAYALQILSQRGSFIEVVSLQSMTSDSLIDLADSYTDLADLREEIKR